MDNYYLFRKLMDMISEEGFQIMDADMNYCSSGMLVAGANREGQAVEIRAEIKGA